MQSFKIQIPDHPDPDQRYHSKQIIGLLLHFLLLLSSSSSSSFSSLFLLLLFTSFLLFSSLLCNSFLLFLSLFFFSFLDVFPFLLFLFSSLLFSSLLFSYIVSYLPLFSLLSSLLSSLITIWTYEYHDVNPYHVLTQNEPALFHDRKKTLLIFYIDTVWLTRLCTQYFTFFSFLSFCLIASVFAFDRYSGKVLLFSVGLKTIKISIQCTFECNFYSSFLLWWFFFWLFRSVFVLFLFVEIGALQYLFSSNTFSAHC